MKPLSKVVQAFWSESIIVPLPGELSFEIAPRSKRLAGFDHLDPMSAVELGVFLNSLLPYVEVLRVDFIMFRKIEVLLSDQNTLCVDR